MPTKFLIVLVVTLLLASCGSPVKPSTTIINPATISLGKAYHDEGAAEKHEAKITITPQAGPVTTMPGQTLSAPAPAAHASAAGSAGPGIAIPFNGGIVMAPPGAALTFETSDTGNPAKSDYSESADGVGASLHTDGDKGNFDASAPQASLGNTDFTGVNGGAKGGKSSGTGGKASADWVTTVVASLPGSTMGVKVMILVGIGLLLAALAYVAIERWMGGLIDWELAGIIGGSGVAFIIFGIVAETYPWVILLLFIGIVGGIVWYVYRWKTKQTTVTKTTTTTQVPTPTPAVPLTDAQKAYGAGMANMPGGAGGVSSPIVQTPPIKLTV